MTLILTKSTRWILRADEPFRGHAQSVLLPDGTVAWSGGLTLEQYQAERGFPVRVIEDDELDALIAQFEAGLITDAQPITEERYWDYLECLPPCRFTEIAGWQVFHVSERLTGDLVQWCGARGGQHFGFTDRAGASLASIARKLDAAAA